MANIAYVDEDDRLIGAGSRKEAIKKGIVHRVVRIFLFNSKGEILIQKRADTLDSVPGRWDNSASGHVDEGEEYLTAAYREMKEEIGVSGIELTEIKKYYSDFSLEALEVKRFNMLYTGIYDGDVVFDENEVTGVKWLTLDDLASWIQERPENFTQGCIYSFKVLQAYLAK